MISNTHPGWRCHNQRPLYYTMPCGFNQTQAHYFSLSLRYCAIREEYCLPDDAESKFDFLLKLYPTIYTYGHRYRIFFSYTDFI